MSREREARGPRMFDAHSYCVDVCGHSMNVSGCSIKLGDLLYALRYALIIISKYYARESKELVMSPEINESCTISYGLWLVNVSYAAC